MVVREFDDFSTAIFPHEANSPLIIDANAELTHSVTVQFFEPVPGRHTQVIQHFGGIEYQQFSQSCSLDDLRDALDSQAVKNIFRPVVSKAPYHLTIVTFLVNNFKIRFLLSQGVWNSDEL